MNMTRQEKLLNALYNGDQLTAKQIASRFKAGNPHEVVHSLRLMGYSIQCVPFTNSKGVVKNFYRLGTPSREIVAAGYRALGARGARFTG